jgi:hypothetical protein
MEPQRQLPEEDRPNIAPNDIPGVRRSENDPKKPGEHSGRTLGKEDLSGEESGGDGPHHLKGKDGKEAKGGATNKLANAGLSAAAKTNPAAAALKKGLTALGITNKKRGGAAATVTIIITLVFTLGFGFLISHELQDIEATMLKYDSKVEQFFEKKAANKILGNLFCRKLTPGSTHFKTMKCSSNSSDDKDTADSEADASDPLEQAMDKFDPTDPAVKEALAKNGITVDTDSSGKFTGISDTDSGDAITIDDIQNNTSGIADTIDNALPEYELGQDKDFTSLEEAHADASFDVATDKPGDDIDKDVSTEITDGVSAEPTVTDETPAENAPPDEAKADSDGAEAGTTLGKASDAVLKAMQDGETEAEAVSAGVSAFGLAKDPATVSTAISDGCSVQQAATDGAKTRTPLIMDMLIRHFTTIISLADQMKLGDMTTSEVAQFMKLLNGNPSLTQTEVQSGSKVRNVNNLPFEDSAEWERETGNPVDSNLKSLSYTPDVDKSSLPTLNSGTQVVDEINNDIPELKTACHVVDSPIGGLFSGLVGAFQIVSDGFTFGAAQAGIIAGNVALTETLQHVVIPDILKYFTPVGLNGLENPTSWMNNGGGGGALSFADYTRSNGGQPESNATGNTQFQRASAAENQEQSRQPIADKVFAIDNPDSLTSKFMMSMPTSSSLLFSDISGFFENIPGELSHAFASITHPGSVFADVQTENPGEPYDITPYGFGDITNDAIGVEHFLYTDVSYDGNTATRISLLGDPSKYNDQNSDPSTTDALHCFLQTYNNSSGPTANETTGNNDPICGSVGSYDIQDDSPQPIGASNVAYSYCDQLDPSDLTNCQNSLLSSGQVTSKDINDFSQYIMDTHVMANFTDLESVTNPSTPSTGGCTANTGSSYFSTQGNLICDKNGKQYIPYGISIINDLDQDNWQTPQFEQASNAQVKAADQYWYVNTIRIQVSEPNFMDDPSPGVDYNTAAMQRLQQEIDNIISEGDIPVVSDNLQRTDSAETGPTARTEKFWEAVADYLASQNNTKYQKVIFDIFNEPVTTDWTEWQSGGDGYVGMQDVVNSIRNTKNSLSNNLIWVEGINYATTLADANQHAITGGNIVYSYHHPDLTKTTSQIEDEIGLNGIGQTAPIVDGEWAQYDTMRAECYSNAPTATQSYLTLLQQNNIGLVFWSLEPGVGTEHSTVPQPVTDIITPSFPTDPSDYSNPNSFGSEYNCNNSSLIVGANQSVWGETINPSNPYQLTTGTNAAVLPDQGAGQEVLNFFKANNTYGN